MRLVLLAAAVAAFAALTPTAASAAVTPTVSATYSESTPGAHGTYTNTQDFTYGFGAEPVGGTEDLKKWIVDSPAGLIGNANAIPEANRCDPAAFDPSGTMSSFVTTGACPASSLIGQAKVYLVSDANSGACPGIPPACIPSGFDMSLLGAPMTGNIYLIKTSPEVPETFGTIFSSTAYQAVPGCGSPPCPLQPKTKSVLGPMTSESGTISDFRIRAVPTDYNSRPLAILTSPPHPALGSGGTPLHIRRIVQTIYGHVGNDPGAAPFLTFPTNCGPWNTVSYAMSYDTNAGTITNLDTNNATDAYTRSNTDTFVPDCSTKAKFTPGASLTLSTGDRNTHPQAAYTVSSGGDPGVDYPVKTVTTMPASITIDTANLPTMCETAQRDTNTCPASSKVGTAKVVTPFMVAGLSGDIYMVRGTGKAIPDLSIFFNNPPNSIPSFRMDGTTKFVGPKGNQIETTFDNGPQNPFTTFTLTFTGGTTGLLTTRACPTGSSSPEDGPVTFAMTGFSGQSSTVSTTPALKNCFGVRKLKKISKCVKTSLKVSPSYQSRDQLSKSELWIRPTGSKKYKKVKTVKKSPFAFNVKLGSNVKTGKHGYKIRAVYKATTSAPKGTVKTSTSSFTRC